MRYEEVVADLTVVGGGLAGVCAAVAAARLGASVSLVQNRPVLGGNASSEIRVWVVGATAHGAQKYARETGLMGELFLENQWRNPEGNPYYWDQTVHDLVRAEPNIALFLNTDVREVEAEETPSGRSVRSVTGWQMGSERRLRFVSPFVVDATGDGLVGALAGADHRVGRESRDEFGESWAAETSDDHTLGSTLFFAVKDVGRPERFVPPSITKDIGATPILRNHVLQPDASGCAYWWIEWGGELDVVGDNERIRDELWAVVFGIWDHIKNSGEYDADTLTLEWVGSIPGKREHRRFLGDHVLTQDDVMTQRPFDDAVGFGGWSIDLHPPGGVYSDLPASRHLFASGPYHLPFRSLYSRNVSNLLLAGRDISASHVAFGSTRVMATCAVTGEAAGTGAVLALARRTDPRGVAEHHAAELRRVLLRRDASLLGAFADDPDDLVLSARMSGSGTLDRIATEPGEGAVDLESDVAILLPVDAGAGPVELCVEADASVELQVEWWSPARGENSIPVERIEQLTVTVGPGRSWISVPAPAGDTDAALLLVVPAVGGVRLPLTDGPAPYGVMVLTRREPSHAVPGDPLPAHGWSAAALRGRSVGLRMRVPRAYAPQQVRGGYARPFDGPRLWSAAGDTGTLVAEWDEPVAVGRIDVIFNDDVDADLVNLHHHRTEALVMPDLVRDYRLEALVEGEWMLLADERGNRVRRRGHPLASTISTAAVRLAALATNGSPWASVVALRVYAESDDRLLHSGPPRVTPVGVF
ncbi:FAD-dependent oxidoreductase [Herbiconiux sp. P15]|uniref:FAD-dependent oxidoreductase n=1 Tax=Herbiconiux liukaitaii TaxID=3342799 RepID=UPI0035B7C469